MCWNSHFCATWQDNFSKKSQSRPISGSVGLRISDVGYADQHLKHSLKPHMIRSQLPPKSGHKLAPDSQIPPIQALYRLRSDYCKALFDNKLLDYSAKQGVWKNVWQNRIRAWFGQIRESLFFIDYFAAKSFRIWQQAMYSKNILTKVKNWSTGALKKFRTPGSR
jgi:hypothetical protein